MTNHVAIGMAALLAAAGAWACSKATPDEAAAAAASARQPSRRVPRLVDVGAGKCIPCKAMAPILDQLRSDYAGRLDVTFVDVWKQPEAAQSYGVHMIPTQIFYGADGRELSRHEGFIDRDEILARWKALGIEL